MNQNLITQSQTATNKGISEQFTPPAEVIQNATLLWDMIVSRIKIPYFVSSWYRCPRLNKLIGGSPTSDHVLGRAVDLDSQNDANNAAIFEWIRKNCEFDQLIWEFGTDQAPAWVHVSYRKNNCRNQILRAYKNEKGKTVYKSI